MRIIFGFFLTFILTGCVYYPQLADIPLIKQKGDLRIDGGITSNISANTTVSYGITDRLSLQLYGNVFHGYYFHGAVGLYKKLEPKTVFEFYTGFGYGHGDAYKDAIPGRLIGNYQLYFTQFNIGRIDCKIANADFGLGLKTGILHSNFMDKNFYRYYSDNGPYKSYKDNSFLLEPILLLRFGGEHLKFCLKFGYTKIFKFSNKEKDIPYSNYNVGLGVNYGF